MTRDDLPGGEMKDSFKAPVQAHSVAGDLISSSTSVNDFVKSLWLLEHAGSPHGASAPQSTASAPFYPVHGRRMKSSCKPGAFYCSAKVGDDDSQEKACQ